ncbi:MAG: LytR/AlgR family response regulator transcription factor [Cyclobacteriaceae bacterium]|jgi:two-component system LytT family response regulator|nr:LytTR family DNA-binding domain-containing protein [Flammeovirgaceae bacterium]
MIKTILIDDEPLAITELQSMLSPYPEIDIISVSNDAQDGIQKIQQFNPQLLFLDINMPGKNGFDLLSELSNAPEVIFVTAYDQFAIKAFEVNALDYILKPVNPERLKEAVTKVIRKLTQAEGEKALDINKRIFIKDGEQCFFVPIHQIFYIESVGNYVRLHFRDKKAMLHRSLNYLEEKLPDEHFFRTSRQEMINVNFIKNIVPYFSNTLQVEMETGIKIDLSQRQSVKFKEKMGI